MTWSTVQWTHDWCAGTHGSASRTSRLALQVNTPTNLKGLAHAAREAGYKVVYKGKMHLSKPLNPDYTWSSADALQYGWTR